MTATAIDPVAGPSAVAQSGTAPAVAESRRDGLPEVSAVGDAAARVGTAVLVLAQRGDTTADLVVEAVTRRGMDTVRIDTADFPGSVSVTARPGEPGAGFLLVDGVRVELAAVRSVYRRSPAEFGFPAAMSGPERRFARLESVFGLGGVLAAQPWRWLDRPSAVADASFKPRQLQVAAGCGLRVPRTVVTSDGEQARAFAREIGRPVVYKSMSTGVVAEQDTLKVVYTALVDAADLDDDAAIGLCPHLFQQWVPKDHDVRLTMVGERCFAVAVHTTSPQGRIDWRSRYDELTYRVCDTPPAVQAGVARYLRAFGLRFGAFDFSVTPDGAWWFLECNPAGQWGWLVEETDLPIADAIADELVSP